MRYDVALLHAPAVFDFHERPRLWGPLADVVPSSALFDMYPVGLTSLLEILTRAGYRTALVNVASHLVRDSAYDVDARLANLNAHIYGIDLHWLPHAQGALELAARVKRAHPDAFVVLGGLSATYFHREIVERYPQVDAVLRGDSTEEPMVALADAMVRNTRDLRTVPNLTYRVLDGPHRGEVKVNPLTAIPLTLDGIQVPAYGAVVRAALHQRSVADVEPYAGWRAYPTTMLLTLRGCTMSCVACGGSRQAYRRVCNREAPAYRSAEDLARDVWTIERLSRHPIFVVGDLRLGGRARLARLLELWRRHPPRNELVFELFGTANEAFFQDLEQAVPRYSLELSIESQDPGLRRVNHKFVTSNQAIERTMQFALAHGARKVDLFFMTGISGQDADSARGIVDYAQHAVEILGRDPRVHPFVAPLGPFIDPGSAVWMDPDLYGYRLFYRTLEDHRQALSHRTWRTLLGYETRWLRRDAIVDVTYEVARGLNDLKESYGAIEHPEAAHVRDRMAQEQRLLAQYDAEEAAERSMGPAGRRADPGSFPETMADRAPAAATHGRTDASLDLEGGSLSPPSEITWKRRRASRP